MDAIHVTMPSNIQSRIIITSESENDATVVMDTKYLLISGLWYDIVNRESIKEGDYGNGTIISRLFSS